MTDHSIPLLQHALHSGSEFTPERLMDAVRRERGMPNEPVPALCVLDVDGEDLEVLTENYRGAHASGAAQSGFTCYRAGRGLVGGRGGSGRSSHPRLAEELI